MPKASAAVATARAVAQRESGRVRDLANALGARYTTTAAFDLDALNRTDADRMKTLVAKYPADDDIAVLYAESLILEWQVARVLALVGLGRFEDADAARESYATFETTLPNDAQWWADPVGKFLPMVRDEMDARLAWAKGHREEAIFHWKRGVAAQDGLTRMESVMPWFHSLRESLGAALPVSGHLREAEQTFGDDLQIDPGSGRSLFGYGKPWRV